MSARTGGMNRALTALLAGAALVAAPQHGGEVVFPRGAHLPIRFLYPITSGQDTAGTPVVVQTMGALIQDSCTVVPPFTQVRGRVTASRSGGRFGKPGGIDIRFDSLEVRRGSWVVMSAVLDSLEYVAPGDVAASGTVQGDRVSLGKRLLPAALAEAVDLAVLPVALLGGYGMARRGPSVQILAGEVGGLRLLAPLRLKVASCASPARDADLAHAPNLPIFTPRSESGSGVPWDPINLIFVGSGPDLERAFRGAGWAPAQARTVRSVVREVVAALTGRSAVTGPVNTEYFKGRGQDGAYELAGPNARIRHHVRVWRLDCAPGLWVGAATEDVGISITKRTHKISPNVDLERDRVVRDLEAAGCADLVEYVRLPGAVTRARTPEGWEIFSDGRAAVVRMRGCTPGDHDAP